ncbi:unnamed protein product, partial [Iphiclides podalirius]
MDKGALDRERSDARHNAPTRFLSRIVAPRSQEERRGPPLGETRVPSPPPPPRAYRRVAYGGAAPDKLAFKRLPSIRVQTVQSITNKWRYLRARERKSHNFLAIEQPRRPSNGV